MLNFDVPRAITPQRKGPTTLTLLQILQILMRLTICNLNFSNILYSFQDIELNRCKICKKSTKKGNNSYIICWIFFKISELVELEVLITFVPNQTFEICHRFRVICKKLPFTPMFYFQPQRPCFTTNQKSPHQF